MEEVAVGRKRAVEEGHEFWRCFAVVLPEAHERAWAVVWCS